MAQATLLNYFQRGPAGETLPTPPPPRPIQKPALEDSDVHDRTRSRHSRPILSSPRKAPTRNGQQVGALNPLKSHDSPNQHPDNAEPVPGQITTPTTAPAAEAPINPTKLFQITTITPSHIPALNALTSTILPVRYSPKFYNEVIHEHDAADLSRAVLYLDRPIGWISCRVQPLPSPSPSSSQHQDQNQSQRLQPQRTQIYIRALCILAPYRERGLATQLLQAVLQPQLLAKYKATAIYAHVWESNVEALAWYDKRGFRQAEMVERYYTRLKPAGAWVVRREIGIGDYLMKDAGP